MSRRIRSPESLNAKSRRTWAGPLLRRPLDELELRILDPMITSLRHELLLIDERIAQLHEKAKKGDTASSWSKINGVMERLMKLCDDPVIDPAVVRREVDVLMQAVQGNEADMTLWAQTAELVELRRRLSDTERRRDEFEKNYVTLQQIGLMFNALLLVLREQVPDVTIQQAILSKLRAALTLPPERISVEVE